jgi:hypothetical protein
MLVPINRMNLPAVTPWRDGVSKGRISILIPLTLTLSRDGERESTVTLQRATGNYQVKRKSKNSCVIRRRQIEFWGMTPVRKILVCTVYILVSLVSAVLCFAIVYWISGWIGYQWTWWGCAVFVFFTFVIGIGETVIDGSRGSDNNPELYYHESEAGAHANYWWGVGRVIHRRDGICYVPDV